MTSGTRLKISAGTTSATVNVFIQDSTTEHGKTGLAYNTAGLVCYAAVAGQAAVQVTLAAQTPGGAYTSGGFCEISSTGMPGVYRFDIPDSLLSANKEVTLIFHGASGMSPALLEIDCSKADADLKWINGQATSGNNATLYLKALDIQTNSGTALTIKTTDPSFAPAVDIKSDSGAGIISTGTYGSGLELYGTQGLLCIGVGNTAAGAIFAGASGGEGIVMAGDSAEGLKVYVQSGNADGVSIAGSGTGRGLSVTGGASGGNGAHILGGAADGHGVFVYGAGAGHGIVSKGGSTGHGMYLLGQGAGAGVKAQAGATGRGLHLEGGTTGGEAIYAHTTSGDGFAVSATVGNGIKVTATGTGKSGVVLNGVQYDLDADSHNLGSGVGGATLSEIEASNVLAKEASLTSAYRAIIGSAFLGTEGFGPQTTQITFDGDTGPSEIRLYDAFPSINAEEGRDETLGETLMGVISGQTFTPDGGWTGSTGGLLWIDTTGPLTASGTLTITGPGHTHNIHIPAEETTDGLVDALTGDLITLGGRRSSVPGINVVLARGRGQSLIAG